MSAAERSTVRARFEIKNRLGLHARAAALLVETVRKYDAEIVVSKDGQDVNGSSILGLMMLAAGQGSLIDVRARGPQARQAVEAIGRLIEQKFLEDEEDP
jgi:phosphocarrier protein HPr